ncbi:MAG: outer membrane beta-barrel protein [Lewinellaceae bacterium]|nr:outer membrane beta-barrel protein [Lewinellaceae bacterium]
MKNLLLTFALLMSISTLALAQFQPGDAFLNGSFSLQFNNSSNGFLLASSNTINFAGEVSSVELSIQPRFGVLVSSNLALGLGLGYEGLFSETNTERAISPFPQTVKSTINRYSFSPFLRYYKSFEDRFGLWLDLYGSVGLGKGKFENVQNGIRDEQEENQFNMQLGIRPGLYYFLNRRFALEASVGGIGFNYDRRKMVDTESDPRRDSSFFTIFDTGIGFRLGLNFFLNRAE